MHQFNLVIKTIGAVQIWFSLCLTFRKIRASRFYFTERQLSFECTVTMSELSKVWLGGFDSDSFWGLGGPQNHESTEQTAGATPHFQSPQGGQAIKPAGARAEPPQPTETLLGGVVFVGGQPPSRLETVWCLRMPFRLPY